MELKSNELRIGNLLQRTNGDILTVKRLDEWSDVLVKEVAGLFTLGYTAMPIPLTEEWLLRLGAKWIDDYVVLENSRLIIRTHLPNLKPASVFAYFDGIKIKKVEFVHQLQNLYFALTGEELTLK